MKHPKRLGHRQLSDLVAEIQNILWSEPVDPCDSEKGTRMNSEKEWDPSTLEAIAHHMALNGLRPKTNDSTYRIVICVDVEAASLKDAYGRVYNAMGKITGPDSNMDWESTDEWFDPDGEEVLGTEIEAARKAFLDEHTEE